MQIAKSRADLFRENAAECTKQKKRASDAQDKASWENLEQQWLNLADEAERSERADKLAKGV